MNLAGTHFAADGSTTPPPSVARVNENFGKLPLAFEANRGQTDSTVKFLSRGRGYGLFLTSSEAVLTLRHGKSQDQKIKGQSNALRLRHADAKTESESVVRLKLVGANPASKVSGLEELPGKSSYFIGNDPKTWRTDVPNFAKVRYQDVHPGVDLVYYGNSVEAGQLEYDFVVAPGADPRAITFEVGAGLAPPKDVRNAGTVPGKSGQVPESTKRPGQAPPLRIDANGDLVIQTGDGEVRFLKPVVYQEQSTVDSLQLTVQGENRNSKLATHHSSLPRRPLRPQRQARPRV